MTMVLSYPTAPEHTNHNKAHSRHRSRIEMVNLLLTTAYQSSEGVAKTRLMYNSEMSWAQLKKYLVFLIENDLITVRDTTTAELQENPTIKQMYEVSSKGRIFLKLYSSLNSQDILVWDWKEVLTEAAATEDQDQEKGEGAKVT